MTAHQYSGSTTFGRFSVHLYDSIMFHLLPALPLHRLSPSASSSNSSPAEKYVTTLRCAQESRWKMRSRHDKVKIWLDKKSHLDARDECASVATWPWLTASLPNVSFTTFAGFCPENSSSLCRLSCSWPCGTIWKVQPVCWKGDGGSWNWDRGSCVLAYSTLCGQARRQVSSRCQYQRKEDGRFFLSP